MEPQRNELAFESNHAAELHGLIANLSCADDAVRTRAVRDLVNLGRSASGALVDALASEHAEVRWQAALALRGIADPATVPALLDALPDEDVGVRWLAAEALCAIGGPAVRPLLERLVQRADSVLFREGAAHVLRSYARGGLALTLRPVLLALKHGAAETAVPPAAYDALTALRRRRVDL